MSTKEKKLILPDNNKDDKKEEETKELVDKLKSEIFNLTVRQKKFCEEYVSNGCNITQAYLSAFETENSNTAKGNGRKLLNKPEILQYIKELQNQMFTVACITPERIALQLAEIAFSNKEDSIYNVTAKLKALDLLQKQLNIQHQKIETTLTSDIEINIE